MSNEGGNDGDSTITLNELLKLVHTKELSIEAANRIYADLSSNVVVLRDVRPNRSRSIIRQCANAPLPWESANERRYPLIRLLDMNTCADYLRYFGRSIMKLRIEYSRNEKPNPKHCVQLDLILNDYCTEFVTELQLWRTPAETLKNLKKPFLKVERLHLHDCILTDKLCDLNQYFPNLRYLEIGFLEMFENGLKKIEGEIFQAHYPNLEGLKIWIDGNIDEKLAFDILRMNSQIKFLFLRTHSSYKNAWAHKYLQLDMSFEKLEELTLHLLQFKDIEKDAYMDFIVKHTSIKKLSIEADFLDFSRENRGMRGSDVNMESKIKIARMLPLLTHVDFDSIIFTLEEMLNFIDECKSLKEFRSYCSDLGQFDHLLERLGDDWQGEKTETIFKSLVHLKRK